LSHDLLQHHNNLPVEFEFRTHPKIEVEQITPHPENDRVAVKYTTKSEELVYWGELAAKIRSLGYELLAIRALNNGKVEIELNMQDRHIVDAYEKHKQEYKADSE